MLRMLAVFAAALGLALLAAAHPLAGVGSDEGAQAAPQGKLVVVQQRGFLITDFHGRVQRRITLPRGRGPIGALQFSKDGARLWFLTGSPGLSKRLWLHVVPTAGRARGRSYPLRRRGSSYSNLRVSADERRIAVGTLSKNKRACGSFVIVSKRGKTLRSFEGGKGIELRAEAWSPDATRLLYTRHAWGEECGKFSRHGSLLMASGRGTGAVKQLSAQRYGIVGPAAWSTDARRVSLFQLNQRGDLGKCPLYVIDARSGARRLLAPDSYPSGVAWPVATGEVVALRAEPNEGIWAFHADSARRRLVAAGGGIEASSADGNRIAIYRSQAPNRGVLDVGSGSFWPFPPAAQRRLHREIGAGAYFLR